MKRSDTKRSDTKRSEWSTRRTRRRSTAALVTVLATAALSAGAAYPATPPPAARHPSAPEPPRLAPPGPPGPAGIDLDTATIPRLQARMADGTLTSSALTRAYLRRIAAVDPKVNAVLRTDPTALRQAAASDARHRRGTARGPSTGSPSCSRTTSTPGTCRPRPDRPPSPGSRPGPTPHW